MYSVLAIIIIMIIMIIIIIVIIIIIIINAASTMSRKSTVKWTQQMNTDVLECKRKAQELVTSGNACQPLTMHIMRPQNGGKILSRRPCAISVKTMAGGRGGCPASN